MMNENPDSLDRKTIIDFLKYNIFPIVLKYYNYIYFQKDDFSNIYSKKNYNDNELDHIINFIKRINKITMSFDDERMFDLCYKLIESLYNRGYDMSIESIMDKTKQFVEDLKNDSSKMIKNIETILESHSICDAIDEKRTEILSKTYDDMKKYLNTIFYNNINEFYTDKSLQCFFSKILCRHLSFQFDDIENQVIYQEEFKINGELIKNESIFKFNYFLLKSIYDSDTKIIIDGDTVTIENKYNSYILKKLSENDVKTFRKLVQYNKLDNMDKNVDFKVWFKLYKNKKSIDRLKKKLSISCPGINIFKEKNRKKFAIKKDNIIVIS